MNRILLAATLAVWAAGAGAQPSVEVLHWWTSGGEANALGALKARFVGGNPPGAAMMNMGPQVWEWAEQGALLDLEPVARAQRWDELLPRFIAKQVKHRGRYVAVPLNVHRVNALFANPAALRKAGIASAPRTWAEFDADAEKLKRAGIIPLAHGGQPWQDVQLFDAVALGVGGPAFYKKALIDLDLSELGGPTMTAVFDRMRRLKGDVDKGSPGRDWNLATAMVARGEAAMQIMGDWAKGELAGSDYLCAASPGSAGSFTVNNDSFAMFKAPGAEEGQRLLAGLLLSEEVQAEFNRRKGSIPARRGVPPAGFDRCSRLAMADLAAADKAGRALPSFSTAVPPAVGGAVTDVVTSHFNSDMSSAEAVRRLVEAVRSAR